MKLSQVLKPFTSFRAQMTAFLAVMLVVTALIISIINQRLERRTTEQVDEYIEAITRATDTVYRSLSAGRYIYQITNQSDPFGLSVGPDNVINHILIVEQDGKIFDSSDRKDVGQQISAIVSDHLPALKISELATDSAARTRSRSKSLKLSMETQRDDGTTAKRDVFVVISMDRLDLVKTSVERDRLIAFVILGLLLIVLVAIFSKRFTRPITVLGQAARQVTAGDLNFKIPVRGPEEVSAVARTFNEMLVGLRSKRELEEQLQRAERSAVVGRLASGIAHEIRNPLNFINLSIDHLRAKFAPIDDAPKAEYTLILVTIKDELARLNRLVSDFLSYGRPAKLKIREIDAQSLIEEVRSLINTQSEQQHVRINIHSNGGGDAKLFADPEQLKTCFSNLMINAVQAMPEGGSLDIALRPAPSHIEIEFSDTGVGIAPTALEQIFEPYYSTKDTGIGLGLPLTKKIIDEHSGQITVKSDLDRGTTFLVSLPRQAQ